MKRKQMTLVFLAALFSTFVCFSATQADEYPEKPVTLIVPVQPGGAHDLCGRAISSVIPQYLGQPMVLKFMPGASSHVGTAATIKAKPDGYTLLFTSNFADTLVPLIENLPYDTIESLVTVCRTNYSAPVLFVAADKPWKTLDDMLKFGKQNPGKLKVCHAGNWGPIFTPLASVAAETGVDCKYIPYQGGGPAVTGTLGGDCDFSAAFPSVIISLYQAKKVRCLAVLGDKRLDEFPGVPTIQELGFKLKPVQMNKIIQVHRKTPEDRIKILRDAFRKINDDVSYKQLMEKLGENMEWMDGPEYEANVRVQLKNQYVELIKMFK
jgi:tripartite-type tricarboxylate transporter receptor subunit TctC